MIKRLVKENVNPLHVAQLSGHRNLKSLDSYSSTSVEQQKSISLIISGQQPCTSTKTVMNPPLHPSEALRLRSICLQVPIPRNVSSWEQYCKCLLSQQFTTEVCVTATTHEHQQSTQCRAPHMYTV